MTRRIPRRLAWATAVTVAVALGSSTSARAQEGPGSRPTAPPPGPPAPGPERAPDLVEPPAALAGALARFDGEAEPGRELKRAFASVVYYAVARDLDRLVRYFHPDLRLHLGGGDFEAVPPAAVRDLFDDRIDGPPEPVALETVLDLDSLRVYTRAAAQEAPPPRDRRGVEPAAIARMMADGDWLVIARLRDADLEPEVFYVLRRDGARFKVVLAE